MCAKKIAVLTSGGDAPGMNAAVRAVVRTAISFGMEVYGVRHGYNGLLTGEVQKMELRSVSNIIQHGGTALFTARSPEFNTPEGVQKAAAKCRELGIDGVVVVGGDGSFRGARDLTGAGVPCIGVPGTIDNDISSSEYTIGYDTAMNTAMEMIDRIRDTTESHDRCGVVEVMGRRCGDIALNTGIAVGAIATLVPEVKSDFEKDIIERIRYAQKTGKRHFIVVVAEGVGHSEDICKRIQEETGIESRATILAMYSAAVPRRSVTVLWQARWATTQLSCSATARATALSSCRANASWTSTLPKPSRCRVSSTRSSTRFLRIFPAKVKLPKRLFQKDGRFLFFGTVSAFFA